MAALPPITAQIKQYLARLAALSDTGYAIAIHIRYTRPTLLFQTYPQRWIDEYTEKGFMLSDPVVHWGLLHTGMITWSDLSGNDPAGVLTAAKANKLFNGITYSTGNDISRTISGHTRRGDSFTTTEQNEIAAIIDDVHRLTETYDRLPASEQSGIRSLLRT